MAGRARAAGADDRRLAADGPAGAGQVRRPRGTARGGRRGGGSRGARSGVSGSMGCIRTSPASIASPISIRWRREWRDLIRPGGMADPRACSGRSARESGLSRVSGGDQRRRPPVQAGACSRAAGRQCLRGAVLHHARGSRRDGAVVRVCGRRGIGVFVPPSAAEPVDHAPPARLLGGLEALDRGLSPPLAGLGDHVLHRFVRRRPDAWPCWPPGLAAFARAYAGHREAEGGGCRKWTCSNCRGCRAGRRRRSGRCGRGRSRRSSRMCSGRRSRRGCAR